MTIIPGAGYVLSTAAKKGLDVTFGRDLRDALEREVIDWSRRIDGPHPDSLFRVYKSDADTPDPKRPMATRLQAKLLALELPSAQDWADAFLERLKICATT